MVWKVPSEGLMLMHPYVYHRQNDYTSSIYSYAQGDVNGDSLEDQVYLVGQETPDSPYITNITLVIQDGRNNKFHSIPLKTNTGYNPRLFLGDFTGSGTDDILVSMDSGGSGGFGYFYIYSFLANHPGFSSIMKCLIKHLTTALPIRITIW